FRTAIQQTRKQVSTLLPYLAEQPLLVIKNLHIWADILKVLCYFKQHPQPIEYARALSIDVPSTFIEEHQKLLGELLEMLLPKSEIKIEETEFERRFGLKSTAPLVRLRFLDEKITPNLPEDLGLSISLWNQQNIEVEKVFLITDELNFLRFPNHPKSIALFASKEVINNLRALDFLHQSTLYFWGDISITAFQQLADLRKHFVNLNSFLMSEKELAAYAEFVEVEKKSQTPENLSLKAAESICLNALHTKEGYKKLLQKHIRQSYLKDSLAQLE
ncbi:MAG: Wadjet anti-phage system protein JetD domain-containing protein, partial [Bacteroidota bacterium]